LNISDLLKEHFIQCTQKLYIQESQPSSLLHQESQIQVASLVFAVDQEGLGVIRSNIHIARAWGGGKSSVYRDPYHLFLSACDKNEVEPGQMLLGWRSKMLPQYALSSGIKSEKSGVLRGKRILQYQRFHLFFIYGSLLISRNHQLLRKHVNLCWTSEQNMLNNKNL